MTSIELLFVETVIVTLVVKLLKYIPKNGLKSPGSPLPWPQGFWLLLHAPCLSSARETVMLCTAGVLQSSPVHCDWSVTTKYRLLNIFTTTLEAKQ